MLRDEAQIDEYEKADSGYIVSRQPEGHSMTVALAYSKTKTDNLPIQKLYVGPSPCLDPLAQIGVRNYYPMELDRFTLECEMD